MQSQLGNAAPIFPIFQPPGLPLLHPHTIYSFNSSALHSVEERIQKLDYELQNARNERDLLLEGVSRYHALFAPIRRMPYDVLIAIFEEYVKANSTHIRRLMLVCRLWRYLIMNTPVIWSYIQLNLSSDKYSAYSSAQKYAEICCQRSRGALLKVVMDFSKFPTITEYLDKRFKVAYSEICDGANTSYRQELQDCEGYQSLTAASWGGPVAFLTSQMHRFHSVTMIFRKKLSSLQYDWFWPIFQEENSPHLVELIIVNGHPNKVVQDTKWLNPAPLRRLVLQSWTAFEEIISANRKPLRSLGVPVDKPQNLQTLTQFTDLRSLTLTFTMYNAADLTELGSTKLSFPSVTFLALKGPVQAEIVRLLELPSVCDLHITRSDGQSLYGLPEVSPVNVTWIVDETKKNARNEMRMMFSKYTGMRTLQMHGIYIRSALELLVEVREKMHGMENLKCITFLNCDTWHETRLAERVGVSTLMKGNVTVDTSLGIAREDLLSNLDRIAFCDSSDSEDDDSDTESVNNTDL